PYLQGRAPPPKLFPGETPGAGGERGEDMPSMRFLGTSAGELYPGIWCRCASCDAARRWGGQSLRQSACALFGDLDGQPDSPPGLPPLLTGDTLFDFPPEIVSQAWRWGVDLS